MHITFASLKSSKFALHAFWTLSAFSFRLKYSSSQLYSTHTGHIREPLQNFPTDCITYICLTAAKRPTFFLFHLSIPVTSHILRKRFISITSGFVLRHTFPLHTSPLVLTLFRLSWRFRRAVASCWIFWWKKNHLFIRLKIERELELRDTVKLPITILKTFKVDDVKKKCVLVVVTKFFSTWRV